MAQAPVKTTIRTDYEEQFAGSGALHGRSRATIPGGITHDGRYLKPFPVYVTRAQGAHKWDADGHQLIDYAVGHGSLILGHNDPDVTEAMRHQLELGTHFGAGHEGEVIWAEQIRKMIPSADQVRFTASGTESTLLAMRVARGYAQKSTILKFQGHFHGWNDYALRGEKEPFNEEYLPGIPAEVLGTVAVLPANDASALEARLAQGDVAGIIIEPSGGSWSTIPLADGFLSQVRELATAHQAVLIFDEVITGFRWAPGGAQERFGVIPDLTTMAKIVAGGMPGGAVAGQTEFMQVIAFKDESGWNASRKVRHAGTFNANPLASAAGTACLRKCADSAVQQYCDDLAARLRTGLNTAFEHHGVPGFAWGESSIFHIAIGEPCTNRSAGDLRVPEGVTTEYLKASGADKYATVLELGMLLEGVHLFHAGGFLTTAHTEKDVDATIAAFDRVLGRMREEGIVG